MFQLLKFVLPWYGETLYQRMVLGFTMFQLLKFVLPWYDENKYKTLVVCFIHLMEAAFSHSFFLSFIGETIY